MCTDLNLNEYPKTTNSMEPYLLDFFKFYGFIFDPKVHILSTYFGRLIQRNNSLNQTATVELTKYELLKTLCRREND